MRTLLIDTSTSFLFVSFYDETKKERIFYKQMVSHNNHSENIINVIEEGLKEANLKLKDFDKVVVGYGPGSYTGLRVGMVVAKMAAYSLDIPLYVVSSLTFVGSNYFVKDGTYIIYNIAKKDHCYLKLAVVNNGYIDTLVDDMFTTDEEFNKYVNKYNPLVINESNYVINEDIIIRLAKKVDDIHSLVPNYLRKANS